MSWIVLSKYNNNKIKLKLIPLCYSNVKTQTSSPMGLRFDTMFFLLFFSFYLRVIDTRMCSPQQLSLATLCNCIVPFNNQAGL